ncbi:MAG: hypothetical protein KGI97_01750 [Alphaproteobacteria bacterium]|nr:hypothetical protein [Alphaproteobacteria bacterium]
MINVDEQITSEKKHGMLSLYLFAATCFLFLTTILAAIIIDRLNWGYSSLVEFFAFVGVLIISGTINIIGLSVGIKDFFYRPTRKTFVVAGVIANAAEFGFLLYLLFDKTSLTGLGQL